MKTNDVATFIEYSTLFCPTDLRNAQNRESTLPIEYGLL